MLSAFPQLFNYSIFAVALLRIVFGLWFLSYGYTTLFKKGSQDIKNLNFFEKSISSLALIVGLFVFFGLFTQVAILIGLFVLILNWAISVKSKRISKEFSVSCFYITLIGLCLLFLGPGVLAIDLPL